MEPTALPSSSPATAAFEDGLGDRRQIVDPTGNETIELLWLRNELQPLADSERFRTARRCIPTARLHMPAPIEPAPVEASLSVDSLAEESTMRRRWPLLAALAVTLMVVVGAGGVAARRYLGAAKARANGTLVIAANPAGAQATVDGQPRGTSPMMVPALEPGEHAVTLESGLGSVKQTVTVESGMTASLVGPLERAAEGVPVSGWVAVESPIELQVYEGDRLLGTSRSERIMVSAGRHEITVVNDAVGYRAARVLEYPGPGRAVRSRAAEGHDRAERGALGRRVDRRREGGRHADRQPARCYRQSRRGVSASRTRRPTSHSDGDPRERCAT